jgi:hypothetical protein
MVARRREDVGGWGKWMVVLELDGEFQFGWSVYGLFKRIRYFGKHKSV